MLEIEPTHRPALVTLAETASQVLLEAPATAAA
jgi:hypothetical protein